MPLQCEVPEWKCRTIGCRPSCSWLDVCCGRDALQGALQCWVSDLCRSARTHAAAPTSFASGLSVKSGRSEYGQVLLAWKLGTCVAMRSAAGVAALLWQGGQHGLWSSSARDMLHLVVVLAGDGHSLDPAGLMWSCLDVAHCSAWGEPMHVGCPDGSNSTLYGAS